MDETRTTPRQPQDHLPAQKNAPDPDSPFRFTHDGKDYALAAPSDVLDAGFARRNRNKPLDDQLFTLLEALADPDTLAAIDSMKKDEFTQFQKDFYGHIGVTLGESLASSLS